MFGNFYNIRDTGLYLKNRSSMTPGLEKTWAIAVAMSMEDGYGMISFKEQTNYHKKVFPSKLSSVHIRDYI